MVGKKLEICMNNRIDWNLTVVFLGLFLGSFLGSLAYNKTVGSSLERRIQEMESDVELIASAALASMEGFIELGKKVDAPVIEVDFNGWNFDGTPRFDPNSILRELYPENFE